MTWLRAFGRFFDQKIGLHRLGIILSLIIITIAAVVLYRKLHNINISKVLTAVATVEYKDVAISAVFVALGYFTLTFYDLFALRTIGRKDVPYRIAALAGFTSYSIGHNVGASVFTGGAVR
jgi:glycosyltransferase 2 family protein